MKKSGKTVWKTLAITALCMILTQTTVQAYNGAILKGIKIDQLNNQDYRVVIKTNKDVPIKKYITAANKVVLDLNDIRPAQFLNTVYSDSSQVDHVIVQPVSDDKLRIFLQGVNIASSKIILDTRDETFEFLQESTQIQAIKPENVSLNKNNKSNELPQKNAQSEPLFIDLSDKKASKVRAANTIEKVKSITPVMSYNERTQNNLANTQDSMIAGFSPGKLFDASMFDWALRFLMLGVIIAGGIKIFSKPKKVEIELGSQNMKNREMDLFKSVDSGKERLTRSLGMPTFKENAAKKPNYNTISRYGMNEYKNSQLPPRKTTPVSERNLNTNRKPKPPVQNNNAKVKTQHNTRPKQAAQTKVTQKQTTEAKQNFDSIKFLETMASIYQKSGRHDLASGIKQNIIQKQQSA